MGNDGISLSGSIEAFGGSNDTKIVEDAVKKNSSTGVLSSLKKIKEKHGD
jgi:hypothetical protein